MKMKKSLAALAAAALCLAAAMTAAGQGRRPGSIRGRVLLPDGRPITSPVKVSLRQLRGDKSVQYTDNDGQFHMPSVDVGLYTVEAEDDRERKYEPGSERVEVFPDSPSIVMIHLKEKAAEAGKERPAAAVAAAELDANVPPAASKEFERGSTAGREGKFEAAVAHMRKALALYPGYLQARNDLGTFLLAQGKLDEAADELAEAVKQAPTAFNPRLNLGIVLVRRHEFAAAAENLDVALSLSPDSPSARLHSGLARLGLGEHGRAEKDLAAAYEAGGSEYALAQYHLGQLYMDRGERARALRAFETYLRDKPDASNAADVKRMMALLR